MNTKRYSYTQLLITILICCNWGSKDESGTQLTGDGKKPEINFFGTILDNTGSLVKAENITIARMFRQIPVYMKPKDVTITSYNPAENIARLDLAEISKISIENPETIYNFLNRPYIEITVLSDNMATENTYIIETSKKVFFDEKNESGPIEREIALTALHEITILGYKENATKSPLKTVERPQLQSALTPQKKYLPNEDYKFNEDEEIIQYPAHVNGLATGKPVTMPGM